MRAARTAQKASEDQGDQRAAVHLPSNARGEELQLLRVRPSAWDAVLLFVGADWHLAYLVEQAYLAA